MMWFKWEVTAAKEYRMENKEWFRVQEIGKKTGTIILLGFYTIYYTMENQTEEESKRRSGHWSYTWGLLGS